MTDEQRDAMTNELHAHLASIRDANGAHIHPADARLVSEAWRWSRREAVANTPGNAASLRYILGHAERIARQIRLTKPFCAASI